MFAFGKSEHININDINVLPAFQPSTAPMGIQSQAKSLISLNVYFILFRNFSEIFLARSYISSRARSIFLGPPSQSALPLGILSYAVNPLPYPVGTPS